MATYYVDFASGDDTHAGTSEATAWKTIPGTRLADNSNWRSTDWGTGTFNSTNKVPAGTIFRLKPGTTMDSTNGGMVWITSTYYATGVTLANPITIEVYQLWAGASGTVTFDGTGITLGGTTGWGLIHITVGGIVVDGKVTDGITVRDSIWCGIRQYAASVVEGPSGYYIKFLNNGTDSGTVTGASEGQWAVLQSSKGTLDHCNFDGDANLINGTHFGESHVAVTGFTVSNCVAWNHNGAGSDGDTGIGFKAQNSQITFSNCTSYNNEKGFDCGEVDGDNVDITYKFVNSIAYSNVGYGMASSGAGASTYSGTQNVYFINCISRDNGTAGFVGYSGPINVHVIHCVADGNGTAGTNANQANFIFWSDNVNNGAVNVYIYNSIGYKPNPCLWQISIYEYYTAAAAGMTLDFDYNAYRAKTDPIEPASDRFACWDLSNRTAQYLMNYTEGPGGAGKDWYDLYDDNSVAPTNGTGHYHCDEHSLTTEPPFTDVVNHIYTLTGVFPGVDISGKGWYTVEMGLDKAGNARLGWDMGPYEYGSVVPNPYARFY
jgi:hypothetical protein